MALISFRPKAHTLTLPTPVLDKEEAEAYKKVADKLGVAVRAPSVITLAGFLTKNFIQVYDRVKVEKYLDKKGDRRWGWYDASGSNMYRIVIPRESPTSYPATQGVMTNSVYTHPIPYPVLCTMETIKDEFEEAQFYIAAPYTHPDPFLAVCLGQEIYVVERWDEPGFRG